MSETFGKDAALLADNGELGEIRISDAAIAVIAQIAATEVEGVASTASKTLSRGVRVETEEDNVYIDISLNIEYSYKIPEVSAKVQEKVKSAIESMTGLKVPEVKVKIAGVNVPEA